MDALQVVTVLRAHETEFRAAGVEGLSIFGSVARGDGGPRSDVDILVRLAPKSKRGGYAYIGQLMELEDRLTRLLGHSVDIVTEPVRKPDLRSNIERDQLVAFG